MVTFKLLDTGFISASTTRASQVQLSDSERAGYTGSAVAAMTLKLGSHSRNSNANTDNKSLVNSTSYSPTALVSVTNPIYRINCVIQKADYTTGWDKNELIQLSRMETTKGVKLLYISAAEAVTGYTTLIEAMGRSNLSGNFSSASPSEDSGTIATTIPYLVGRVKNLSISDDVTGTFWRISFDFEVSG